MEVMSDAHYRDTPGWTISRRANAVFWLLRYRVNDHVYCLKRYADPVPLKVLRDMARVAPKGAVLCGRKDCGHG